MVFKKFLHIFFAATQLTFIANEARKFRLRAKRGENCLSQQYFWVSKLIMIDPANQWSNDKTKRFFLSQLFCCSLSALQSFQKRRSTFVSIIKAATYHYAVFFLHTRQNSQTLVKLSNKETFI